MAELLVFCEDVKTCVVLDNIAGSKGHHVRIAHEAKTACEWLKYKSFDIAFVEAKIPFSVQQEIATLLWVTSPHAKFYIFDTSSRPISARSEFVLAGAQVLRGDDAGALLLECLEGAGRQQNLAAKDLPIIVIDDLDSQRDILCFYIESLGYPSCRGFASAKEALRALENERPRYCCIITDMRMPEMDGKQFISYVRSHAALSHLPIIVLTAHGTAACLVDCLRAGASGFLVKPPKRNDIVREINKAGQILQSGADPVLVRGDDVSGVEDMLSRQGLII